ncbi:MAG: hypothetical protein RJA58_1232 [Pseudomonadota bacterium]|jgi:hypothetical protein
MDEWRENDNGNYMYVISTDEVMTVFRRRDGDWAGAFQDRFTKGTFNTAEEAMQAMEPILEGDTSMLKPANTGWVANKKGAGFHIRIAGQIATVKPARSGSWYATVDGEILKGQWFDSAQEAMGAAARHLQGSIGFRSSALISESD